ncbi:MAG: elongation factor Tu [Nitrososphaeraceae archaeon]|nr:elongation factor Tu [Nitrososphaeraceae archaeon]
MLENLNIAVLGDYTLLENLGKRGTTSDISLYDRKSRDKIITYIAPISFPDKIQSLIQVLNMTEFVILNLKSLDKYFAEQVIALDSLEISSGFILSSYEVDTIKLNQIIKDTSVANFKFIDNIDSLKIEIDKLTSQQKDGDLIIPIDHSFDVKGVGTVILGVIRQGKINVYDKLKLLPLNREILVKSIQIHDDPANIAFSNTRVGLSLKGVAPDELERGDIICSGKEIKVSSLELEVFNFSKIKYYKKEITENQNFLISVGLQIKPLRILIQDSKVKLILEKPIVYYSNQKFIILKPDSQSTRIIAKGTLP